MKIQVDLFDCIAPNTISQTILNDDGQVTLYKHLFDVIESDQIFRILIDEIKWKQELVKMHGKSIPIPRLTAWYGDPDRTYKYSGISMNPSTWHPLLLAIKSRVESSCGQAFNSVLLNLYRNGNDSVY